MKLHTLSPSTTRPAKRLGRGYGSGKGGHTSSRGQKGQKTRGSIPAHFVGSSWVWFKRLPFLRGKSRFNPLTPTLTLTLTDLDRLPAGAKVDLATLIKAGLIRQTYLTRAKVKVVNSGKLTKKLSVNLRVSQGAKAAIEQAGGTVIDQQDR